MKKKKNNYKIKEYIVDSDLCYNTYCGFDIDHNLIKNEDIVNNDNEEDQDKLKKEKITYNIHNKIDQIYLRFLEDQKTYLLLKEKQIPYKEIPDIFKNRYDTFEKTQSSDNEIDKFEVYFSFIIENFNDN